MCSSIHPSVRPTPFYCRHASFSWTPPSQPEKDVSTLETAGAGDTAAAYTAHDDDNAPALSTVAVGHHHHEDDDDEQQQPLLHETPPAGKLSSGPDGVPRGGVTVGLGEPGGKAEKGGVEDHWVGGSRSVASEDLFSHRVMEEGDCGPVAVAEKGGTPLQSSEVGPSPRACPPLPVTFCLYPVHDLPLSFSCWPNPHVLSAQML